MLSAWANKGLAVFQDNPEWLRNAAEYLENPPVPRALGEEVYGVVGRVSRKVGSRRYGPDGTKEPQPRVTIQGKKPITKAVAKPVAKPKPKTAKRPTK